LFYFRAKALYDRRKAICDSKTSCFTVKESYDINVINIMLVNNLMSDDYKDNDVKRKKRI